MPAAAAARTCSRSAETRSATTVPGGKSFISASPNFTGHLLSLHLAALYCCYSSALIDTIPRRRPGHYAGGGKDGARFARKAVAPSTMSSLPIAWTSIPRPVLNESRAAFHHTFELIFAIS